MPQARFVRQKEATDQRHLLAFTIKTFFWSSSPNTSNWGTHGATGGSFGPSPPKSLFFRSEFPVSAQLFGASWRRWRKLARVADAVIVRVKPRRMAHIQHLGYGSFFEV